mgnify:CR=1 FL=1
MVRVTFSGGTSWRSCFLWPRWPPRLRPVRFGVTLTVIATGLYRLLGKHLHGFDHAKARQIFRRFLDTNAKVTVSPDGVHVRLPRRAHNPLLLESGLLATSIAVPWWGGAPLKVEFP